MMYPRPCLHQHQLLQVSKMPAGSILKVLHVTLGTRANLCLGPVCSDRCLSVDCHGPGEHENC